MKGKGWKNIFLEVWKWIKAIVFTGYFIYFAILEVALLTVKIPEAVELSMPETKHAYLELSIYILAALVTLILLYLLARLVIRTVKAKAGTRQAAQGKNVLERGFRMFFEVGAVACFICLIGLLYNDSKVSPYIEHRGRNQNNAGLLRSTLAIYYGDHQGRWPKALGPEHWEKCPMSAYLDSIPDAFIYHEGKGEVRSNKVSALKAGQLPAGSGDGWAYDSTNGFIFLNSNEKDPLGRPYTSY